MFKIFYICSLLFQLHSRTEEKSKLEKELNTLKAEIQDNLAGRELIHYQKIAKDLELELVVQKQEVVQLKEHMVSLFLTSS